MSCAVLSCKSLRRLLTEGDTTSFHRFPKENPMQLKWLQALNIDDKSWVWTKNKQVCSKHFRAENYVPNISKKVLKPDAVPTLLLNRSVNKNLEISPIVSLASHCQLQTSTSQVSDNISLASTSASTSRAVDSSLSISRVSDDLSLASASRTGQMSSQLTISTSSSGSQSISKGRTLDRMKRKRKMNETHESHSTSTASTSSGTKRRRYAFIKTIHSYSASPSTIIKKNVEMKKSQVRYRKRLYTARRQVARLQKKVFEMKTVMDFLKKQDVSHAGMDHIDKTISDVPHLLMSRYLKNVQNKTITHEKYPEPLRRFAATLQFYSSKAYEEVRKEFSLALPDQATLRKWFANIDCDPGFIDLAFDLLGQKAEEAKNCGRELCVSLMLDEMSIKKGIEYDGHKVWGYVDIGIPLNNDQLEIAGEVLVLNVVSHQAPWKVPIAYFLIKSLSGQEKANLVNEAISRLKEKNVTITSVTCDGPSAHFMMMKNLGCKLDPSEAGRKLDASFGDPEAKVYGIFDSCHMLKLMRNNLAQLGSIKDPDGNTISWDYIKKLHDIQEEETLNLGNKLTKRHIDFKNQKMKVSLSAQTLSQSVADAIKYLRLDANHPYFKNSEATEKFITRINRLFDILNSKNPFAKGDKAALRESNEEIWRPFLNETVEYLLRCTDVAGRPLYLTPQKTPFVGFAITIVAVCGIFDDFVKSKRLNYLLTYKLSQDHLETFFCAIRCRNGWNNNPTALQFKYAFRRLLLHTRISGRGGNCRVIDSTVVLEVPSKSGKAEETVDLSLVRKYGFDIENLVIDNEEYDLTEKFIPLSELTTNVVEYMAGYVIRMLEKKKTCPECLCHGAFENEAEHCFKLIERKNRGGLKRPSQGVIRICLEAEKMIRRLMMITENKLPVESGFQKAFVLTISQKFYSCNELFSQLSNHFLETPLLEESHFFLLIKNIVGCYVRIRFFNLAKRFSQKIQGPNVRSKLGKLILFNHQ